MDFSIGDTVEVTNLDGTKQQGKIETISPSNQWSGGYYSIKLEYGVRIPEIKWLRFYQNYEITKVDTEVHKSFCDCGAVKAALPYPPSGHAYYCILFKDSK